MPKFSEQSERNLATCHPQLQQVFREVIKTWDCTIVAGHRGRETQDKLYVAGLSKLKFPDSLHNSMPSRAVDAAPWFPGKGIPWTEHANFYAFGGFVLGVAAQMGIRLRWGGDWNGNHDVTDQKFVDLPHFELRDREAGA